MSDPTFPVFLIVFILSILSLSGSIIIVVTYIIQKCYYKVKLQLTQHYVAIMSISDAFISANLITVASNIVFNDYWYRNVSTKLCFVLGLLQQLCFVLSPAMNITIALGILLPTINLTGLGGIKTHIKYHFLFVVCVTISLTSIPAFFNVYGIANGGTNKYNLDEIQCWIVDEKFYLVLYFPITLYVCACLMLFMYYIYKRYVKQQQYDHHQHRYINQMTWYTVIFVCQWLPSVICRWINTFKNIDIGIGIISLFWIGHSIIGTGNVIVWIHYFKDNIDRSDTIKKVSQDYQADFGTFNSL